MLVHSAVAQVVDFADLPLPGAETFENNTPPSFTSGGASFNNTFTDFGGGFTFWAGWSYSNVTDNTTPGFGNQHGNITGGGFGGSENFAVGFVDTFGGTLPTIDLPAGLSPQSVRVTNTTYPYLSIRDGNDGAGFVRQFGDDPGNGLGDGNEGEPDTFRLLVTGLDASDTPTGTVEFFLADYRAADNADDYVVDEWELLDLTPLGPVESLQFDLETTDVGMFGANTPLYFAIDDLTLAAPVAVPEPAGWLMIVVCGLFAFAGWRAVKIRSETRQEVR